MGMVTSSTTSSSTRINGIDPENEARVTHLKEKLVEGDYFGSDRHPILLSRKLAGKLKIKLRSKVVLDTPYYFQIAVEVLLITLIAALFPAYKAIKLKPVEAIGKI